MKARSKRFEDKSKKLHRLLSILRILDTRARCSPATLSKKFGATERSIYRDINDLNSSGFSIVFDRDAGAGTYRFTDADFTLRDLDLNDNELMALLLGKQATHGLGKPFEDGFRSILKKARTDTGSKTREKAKRLAEEQRFWIDIDPLEGFEKIEPRFKAVNDAMDRKVEIEIVYKAMKDQKETRRTVAPYGLIFSYGLWYVLGHCNLRDEIRVFALDCIKDIGLTDRSYAIPAGFKLAEYFGPGRDMVRYGEPVEVALEFGDKYARWIKRRKWHPMQKIEERPDGSIIFRVTVRGTRELKWWIYHWIPFCKVLSPPELRKEMMGEMREMMKVYGEEYER
ncbi:MAG: WYL domain-containing transcriptional regulator [Deltaproteobacteria bacterium]|nr:WYL domain-containing transcriptional regulator [Deltaproteobacteria bacterium]